MLLSLAVFLMFSTVAFAESDAVTLGAELTSATVTEDRETSPKSGVANPEGGVTDPEGGVTDPEKGTDTDVMDGVLEAPTSDNAIIALESEQLAAGWGVDENGNICYYNPDGSKAVGYFFADGRLYYARSNGAVITYQGWSMRDEGGFLYTQAGGSIIGGFVNDNGVTYCIDELGVQHQGYFFNDSSLYYAHSSGAVVTYQGWTLRDEGDFLYTWAGGRIIGGFVQEQGKTYYVDCYGVQQQGYISDNDDVYYAHGSGEVIDEAGWYTRDDGVQILTGDKGKISSGKVDYQGASYYVNDRGEKGRGYFFDNGSLYYANAQGSVITYQGWTLRDEGGFLYTWAGGRIVGGFVQDQGKTYYVDCHGVQKNGYIDDNGKKYYAKLNGEVITYQGWTLREDNKFMYTHENGEIRGGFLLDSGKTYYVDENGLQKTGYFFADNKLYYAWLNGSVITYKGWSVRDDGVIIYTQDGGWIIASFVDDGAYRYYVDCYGVQQKNVFQANDGKYYCGNPIHGYLHTGWIESNSNRYFFIPQVYYAATGPYTVDGTNYLFSDTGILQGVLTGNYGIDVSMHQGVIDWNAVKNSGMQFAIIRILGANNSGYYIDPYFETNMNGALGVGIQVGAYIYSYAFNTNEILQEVQLALPALLKYKDRMTYPVYIDYEDKLLLQNTSSNEQRTEILRTGMDELNKNGFLSGFYTYYNFAQNYINTQQLIDEGYDFWVAHTGAGANPWNGASMWQYSHSGSVPGINGNVDMNFSHVNYNALNQTVTVYDSNSKTNVTGKIRDIVARMVQNEVGSGIGLTGQDKMKLLAAQTVASHSWLRYQISHGLATPTVGLSAPSADVLTAANRVIRFTVQYNGSVANTAYTASSGAYTNSSQNMGWGYLPYLTSVESKYDAQFDTGYYVGGSKKSCFPWTWTTDQSQMRTDIYEMTGYYPTGDASGWITVNTDANHNVTSITANTTAGVRTIRPDDFLAKCLGVISMNITRFQYNASNGTWTIESNGHGHGVGMSQCGAAGYIANGQDWRWVLNHYYPRTTIAQIA